MSSAPTDVADRAAAGIAGLERLAEEVRQDAQALLDLAARIESMADRLRHPAPRPDTRGESA